MFVYTINRKKLILIFLWWMVVAVTAFIWINSCATVEESDGLSRGIMSVIKDIVDPKGKIDPDFFNHLIRKTAHFVEFMVLGVLYTLICYFKYYNPFQKEALIIPMFATLSTAVTDEFIQQFAGRGDEVKDVVLDFSGALFGIVITALIISILINRTKREKI